MPLEYDIFISYKRKSLPTANNLYYRLTTRGYSTFFDLEEMGRDNFNVQLLSYIENAKDVFVILEEGSLDACKSQDWEKDWFCYEIGYALEKKKNIIPILIGGYKMPSEDFFPDKLKEFHFKQAPEFNFSFFDAYLDKLIEKDFLLSKPNLQEKTTSVFKFYSNENCQVFKEGKLVCSLEGMLDEPYYLPVLRKGDYRFKAVNLITSDKQMLKEHIDADEEKDVDIEWESRLSLNIDQEWLDKREEDRRLVRIVQNGKFGFVDRQSGEIVISCKWTFAGSFQEGLAFVKDEYGKHGFIDMMGNIVISCKWNGAADFSEGLAAVRDENNKCGFIDRTGTEVIPCKWQSTWSFNDGLARVKDEYKKYGFIDKTGNLVIPCKWEYAKDFQAGLAKVSSLGKDGFIDKKGNIVVSY